ncbi:SMI1/KNR4 family protein [uncultured Kordia sp.]|uniref:SMI1/KNR4 family protein n=1 Tax=uncultured Kordia sp. TaxID=507699 RepID=UPI00262FEAE6|nr:SMI1/KNR4 family protein [uncultured Kordia sp.]
MNNLQLWKEKYKRGRGLEIDKISGIQSKYSINYPKAYKEFLFVSGDFCRAIPQSFDFDYEEERQQQAQKLLKEFKLSHLIKKPFWVIATDANTFYYFHLDEGDNPPVYRLDCEYYEEYPDKYSFGKIAESFQAWIEKGIEYYEMDPANK